MPTGIYIRTKEYRNKLKKAMNRPAVKLKLSIAQLKKYQNLVERKKNSNAQKIAQNKPEVKVKTSGKNHYTYYRLSKWKVGIGTIDIHNWLRHMFGKANKCNNREKHVLTFNCSGKSKRFDWAKKKNCNYERKRENFYMLCGSCHSIYDEKGTHFFNSWKNPWNKNLTKYTDERIRQYGLKSGENRKGCGYVPKTTFKKGQKPWNYGLTKETDMRLKRLEEKSSKTKKIKKICLIQ